MDRHVGMRWNPAFLGPLDSEFTPVTGEARLFPGEDRFLSRRKLDAREKLWRAVEPVVRRVLDDDETILHIMPAVHNPRFLEVLGFGMWYVLFFRAALVLTDRRVVEVMLRKPDAAGTKICSYSWGQVEKLSLRWGGLTLKPVQGRTQKWAVQDRGDRKLLKLLLPLVEQQLLPGDGQAPRPVPLWHCPECGAASADHPEQCGQCETVFKSRRLAAGLALAFPGAGLLYAGHPLLAVFDLVGEGMLFLIVAAGFLTAVGAEEVGAAVLIGAILFFFTKLESAHLASVLAHRTRPDPKKATWLRFAVVGAAVSLGLMAIPPVLSGALGGAVNLVDRDLDFAANELGWSGSHEPDEWLFGSEPNQRSEWIRDDGQGLFVWSLPMGPDETEDDFIAAVTQGMDADSVEPTSLGGLEGIRVIENVVGEDGEPLVWVRWMLFDSQFADVHILGASALPSELTPLQAEVDQLVRDARWVAAGY